MMSALLSACLTLCPGCFKSDDPSVVLRQADSALENGVHFAHVAEVVLDSVYADSSAATILHTAIDDAIIVDEEISKELKRPGTPIPTVHVQYVGQPEPLVWNHAHRFIPSKKS